MVARSLYPARTFFFVVRGDQLIRAEKAVIALNLIGSLKLFNHRANPQIEPIRFLTNNQILGIATKKWFSRILGATREVLR